MPRSLCLLVIACVLLVSLPQAPLQASQGRAPDTLSTFSDGRASADVQLEPRPSFNRTLSLSLPWNAQASDASMELAPADRPVTRSSSLSALDLSSLPSENLTLTGNGLQLSRGSWNWSQSGAQLGDGCTPESGELDGGFRISHSNPALSAPGGGVWLHRVPVAITETGGSDRTNETVNLPMSFNPGEVTNARSEIRLADGSGTEQPVFVQSAVYSGLSCTAADLLFTVPSLSANGSDTWYVYFGNPLARAPVYDRNVYLSEPFTGPALPEHWSATNLDGLSYSVGGTLRVQGTATSGFWQGVSFDTRVDLPGSFNISYGLRPSAGSGTGYLALLTLVQDAQNSISLGLQYDAGVGALSPAKFALSRTVGGTTTIDHAVDAGSPGVEHALRLECAEGTYSAFVDGTPLGSVDCQLSPGTLRLSAAARATGDAIDVSFDGLVASSGFDTVLAGEPVLESLPGSREDVGYLGSATLTSPLITNTGLMPLGVAGITADVPSGTCCTLALLGPSNETLVAGLAAGEAIPLPPEDNPSFRLQAALSTTDPGATPRLTAWGLGDLWSAGIGSGALWSGRENISLDAQGASLDRSPDRWNKSAAAVLNPGVASTFDDQGVAHPWVVRHGGLFLMYYAGYDGSRWRIGLATSTDGSSWTRYPDNPILVPGGGWESSHLDWPCVLWNGHLFEMWYAGSSDGGTSFSIGHATSEDGIAWTRDAGNPVMGTGAYGSWSSSSVFAPRVCLDAAGYTMYLAGRNATATSTGRATSPDGSAWNQETSNPVLSPAPSGWSSSGVVPGGVQRLPDGTLRMWYAGFNATLLGVGLADSADGIAWSPRAGPVLSNGTGQAFDKAGAGFPSVLFEEGLMWYSGSDGARWRVGMARAKVFPEGSLLSNPVDLWTAPAVLRMSASTTVPAGTSVAVQARTSPDGATWSAWSTLQPSLSPVPSGRYIQLVATLRSQSNHSSPLLEAAGAEFEYYHGLGRLELPAVDLAPSQEMVSVVATAAFSGASVAVEAAPGDGASWSVLEPGVPANLSGSALRLRVVLSGDHSTTPGLTGLSYSYTFRTFPSDCSLDVGGDGRNDWAHLGIFTDGELAGGLAPAINSYLEAHRNDTGDTRLVPLSFSSATSGTILASSLAVHWSTLSFPNNPPRIDSQPPGRAIANELYIYIVDGRDPDRRDRLSYTLEEGPGGMTLSGTTGELTWQPTSENIGYHDVRIVVSDGRANASQRYVLTVSSSPVNNPPLIEGSPPGTATVGYEYSCDFTATDPDGDRVRFSLSSVSPAGASIDETAGHLVWIPAPGQAGFATFRVLASDGVDTVRLGFTVDVSAQGANGLPAVTSSPPDTARALWPYRHNLSATDPDGDGLTFSLVSGPANATLTPDGRFEWTPDAAETGTTGVLVRVSDGKGFSLFNFTIRVTGANRPPIFLGEPDLLRVRAGSTWTFTARASDPDADSLSFSLLTRPSGMSIDPATGALTWAPSASLSGRHPVVVAVTDGYATTYLNFTLSVEGGAVQQDFMGQYAFVVIVVVILLVGGVAVIATMGRRSRPAGPEGAPPVPETRPEEGAAEPYVTRAGAPGPEGPAPAASPGPGVGATSDLPPPEPAASAEAEPMKPAGSLQREIQVATVAPLPQGPSMPATGPAAAGEEAPAPAAPPGGPLSGVRLPPPAPTLRRPSQAPAQGERPELYKPIPGPYGEAPPEREEAPPPDDLARPPSDTARPPAAPERPEAPSEPPAPSGVSDDMDFISSFLKRREAGAAEEKVMESSAEWGMLKDFRKELETSHTRPREPAAPPEPAPPAEAGKEAAPPKADERPAPKKPDASLSLDDILSELEK